MIGWRDLAGQWVGIWGMGREGQANLRKLRAMGIEPTLVDDNPAGAGVLATKDGGVDALLKCDVVVKTPGISRYRHEVTELTAHGVVVTGGLGLWLAEQDPARVVCVTGTKGKSTTVSIIVHLLTGMGLRSMTGGNIGVSPWDPDQPQDIDYWAIEVSSYQATDLRCAPQAVAVTSLHPDHLDWHGGAEQYYRDKLSICTLPGADLTVANGDSDLLRERRGLLGPRVEWVGADDDPDADWMLPMGLPGQHNRRNALIARRCIQALGVAAAQDENSLRAAAMGYQGLPNRLATVAAVQDVIFVDDSLSTNVLPTLAALDAFPGHRIALLVGGHDRGIDYAPLAAGLRAREAPTLVLTLPENGPRIHAAISEAGDPVPEVIDCDGMDAAVRAGFRWARPDGIVLLSPAAPSFGQFRDYRDRGEAFARAALSLQPLCPGGRRAAGRGR